jgi:phage gp46-like protein
MKTRNKRKIQKKERKSDLWNQFYLEGLKLTSDMTEATDYADEALLNLIDNKKNVALSMHNMYETAN